MPTRNGEAFGRTIVESLARGTPVLGSDNGAVPELLRRRSVLNDDTELELYFGIKINFFFVVV